MYIAIARSGRIGQHKATKMKYMLGIRMRKCGLEWGNIIKMQSHGSECGHIDYNEVIWITMKSHRVT